MGRDWSAMVSHAVPCESTVVLVNLRVCWLLQTSQPIRVYIRRGCPHDLFA